MYYLTVITSRSCTMTTIWTLHEFCMNTNEEMTPFVYYDYYVLDTRVFPPSLWPGRVLRKYHYPSCSHCHRRLLSGICFSEPLCSFERHCVLSKTTALRIYLGECVFIFQGSRQEKQQLHLSDLSLSILLMIFYRLVEKSDFQIENLKALFQWLS